MINNKLKQIIKYLFFGILTTFVSILTYALFTDVFHINYIISNIMSWIVSVIFAFITNKIFVFQSRSKEKQILIKEIISFYGCRILTLLLEIVLMYLLVDILSIDDMYSKIVSQIIVIVTNYIFSKIFVFKV